MLNYWIIDDLGDTDLSTLMMAKFAVDNYPDVRAYYELKFRSDTQYTGSQYGEIVRQVKHLREVRFSEKSLDCLRTSSARDSLGSEFMTYLEDAKVNPDEVYLWLDDDCRLHATVESLWSEAILWEMIILPIVSEVYYAYNYLALPLWMKQQVYLDAHKKGTELSDRGVYFVEMGTRRRYSLKAQRMAMSGLIDGATNWINGKKKCHLLGTSNVMLAAEFDLAPQDTMSCDVAATGVDMWLTNDLEEVNGVKALDAEMELVGMQKNQYCPMRYTVRLSGVRPSKLSK